MICSLYWRRTTPFFITKLPVVVCDCSSQTIVVIGDSGHFLDAGHFQLARNTPRTCSLSLVLGG
jgi:hypothetical protein